MHADAFPEIRSEVHFVDRIVRCYWPRPANIGEMLATTARRYAQRDALVCEDVRLSYDALDRHVSGLAAALAGRGIRQGDRVALLLPNGIEFILLLYATMRMGAVAVPLNIRAQTSELAYYLGDCRAKLLFVSEELAGRLPARAGLSALEDVFVVAPSHEPGPRLCGLIGAGADPGPVSWDVPEETTAVIMYTSGTTGKAKGAMLTHLGLVHSAVSYRQAFDLGPQDCFVVVVPLSHVTGLTGAIFSMMCAGGTLVVARHFKAAEFLDLAQRERMSVTIMVPAMYKLCLLNEKLEDVDLSTWRVGGYGGAIMPVSVVEELTRRLPGLGLLNCYGATETAAAVTILSAAESKAHSDSVGRCVPCGELLIMDDDGREVSRGTDGEIWLRWPGTVAGYWDKPEATQREFVNGYWRSGDVGALSNDGLLRIYDRKKDMINRGGFKIYPAEVENVLEGDGAVLECAVIGTPCPVLGERVHAVIVPRGKTVNVDGLRAACAAVLSDYKVPETFSIRSEPLPRNANGKVLKRDLRAEFETSRVTRV